MGAHTEHNWRPVTKHVSYRTERGRHVAYDLHNVMGRCTRCGCVRERASYVGAPWLDAQGREIPNHCASRAV